MIVACCPIFPATLSPVGLLDNKIVSLIQKTVTVLELLLLLPSFCHCLHLLCRRRRPFFNYFFLDFATRFRHILWQGHYCVYLINLVGVLATSCYHFGYYFLAIYQWWLTSMHPKIVIVLHHSLAALVFTKTLLFLNTNGRFLAASDKSAVHSKRNTPASLSTSGLSFPLRKLQLWHSLSAESR